MLRAPATLLLLSVGCADLRVVPHEGTPAPQVADVKAELAYQRLLGRWLRRAEVYQGLDSRVFVAAAYESLELREAKVARLATFKSIPEPEARELLTHERADHARFIEFIVGIHTNERRWDDFARPGSMWRIALASDAGEALPLDVERLPRPDSNLRGIYPFLEDFWTGYRLRFPVTFPNGARLLPEGIEKFSLKLSSAVGKAELTFDPEKPGASPSEPVAPRAE